MSGSAKYYNWLSNMTYRHSYAQSVHVHPNLSAKYFTIWPSHSVDKYLLLTELEVFTVS